MPRKLTEHFKKAVDHHNQRSDSRKGERGGNDSANGRSSKVPDKRPSPKFRQSSRHSSSAKDTDTDRQTESDDDFDEEPWRRDLRLQDKDGYITVKSRKQIQQEKKTIKAAAGRLSRSKDRKKC